MENERIITKLFSKTTVEVGFKISLMNLLRPEEGRATLSNQNACCRALRCICSLLSLQEYTESDYEVISHSAGISSRYQEFDNMGRLG